MAWRRGQALGRDPRERVLADAGRPARAVAAVRSMLRTGVSVPYVAKARQRLRDAGEAHARPQRNCVAPRLAPHHGAIRAEVAKRSSAGVAELRAWLASARGAVVGHAAVWRTLGRLGLTRKKAGPGGGAGPPGRGRGPARRAAMRPTLDPAKLVFLDETWATTNMARRYGRAPRGERALDAVPHGRWRTTTVIAAPRADGIAAPLVLEGAINGPGSLAYVRQFLAPALRPGDVLVMDNLGSR